jgi:CheY-like chemotaxis protein
MPKILIIEDDPRLQTAYQAALIRAGFEVTVVPDGLEALQAAREQAPDVILFDQTMPNLGGLEFLKVYDIKHRHRQTKALVFTSIPNPADMQQALALGASKYFSRAVLSPGELVAAVQEVLC